jgi:hypothetical protein
LKTFHKKTTATAPICASFLKSFVIFATVLMVALCTVLLWTKGYQYFHYSGKYITIEMKTPVAGYGQIYFDRGLNYQEKDSLRFKIRPTSSFEKYRLPLPESTIKTIRIDPLDRKGPFEIKSLSIETRDEKIVWDSDKLAEQIIPLQQIAVENTKTFFAGISTGEDPNFYVRGFVIPDNRHTLTHLLIVIVVFTAGIAFMGVVLFLMFDSLIRSDSPGPRNKPTLLPLLQHIMACGLVLVIIGFYIWTATSNFKSFQFIIDGVYNDVYVLYVDLADALLEGKLSLLTEPSEELIALADPYDPLQNHGLRLYDASLYKGHYYLYFGPAPVLAAFLPWKLLTGMPMPHNLAGAFFAVGGFIVSILLMILIVRGAEIKGSFFTFIIGIIMLGLCNMVLPALRLPFMYEVASLSAYAFSMFSLFFIFSFLLLDNRKMIHLLIASLFYGLAIASRFSYVYGVVIFLIPLWSFLDHQKVFSRSSFKKMAIFLITVGAPLTLCVGLLLLYNYFRFGNFLEFGLRYQLGIVRPLDYPFFSVNNFWINNYVHLLSGIFINGSFPFFHVQSLNIPEHLTIPSYYPIYDVQAAPPAAGLLMNLPFLWIIIPGWIYLKWRKLELLKPIRYFTSLLLLGGLTNWLVVSFFSFAVIRYVIDFLPMFLLFSCLSYFLLYDHLHEIIVGKAMVQCIAVTTVIYAALANIGMSIESYGGIFKKENPELYAQIEHFFDFIPYIINQL